MKTLIVYDSLHGNTEQIAESIGKALSGQTRVLHVKKARAMDMDAVNRLIVGSPTHGGKATAAITDFLNAISPSALAGVKVAAFDTRLSAKLVGIFGYAAGKIMAMLSKKGATGIAAPEGFIVKGSNGPLQVKELERAAEWAKALDGQNQAEAGTKGGDTLKKLGSAGFIIGAVLLVVGCFNASNPTGNARRSYISHPDPAVEYAQAVQRVDELRAAEVGLRPDSRVILLTHGFKARKAIVLIHGHNSSPASLKELGVQFYDLGYNVLITPMPYHGLPDRMTTAGARLRSEDMIRYTDEVVDIGRGLGDHLTVAGISLGGLMAGWAAQQRPEVDLAVLISPGFAFKALPEFLTPLVAWLLSVLPNWFVWENAVLKADKPPEYNYPRWSTHSMAQIVRLGSIIRKSARQNASAARSILVVTNASDPDVDNTGTGKVVDLWRNHGAADLRTYQFPADLQLGHDLIDPQPPNQKVVTLVYPKLIELIEQTQLASVSSPRS